MAVGQVFFVQFPHPGGEHHPPGAAMPWNVGTHRRKFLLAPGRYLGPDDDVVQAAELALWAEWEPPSQIIARWPVRGQLPRALHRPYWTYPVGAGLRQNTDPWVWGQRMLYSNCKQTHGPAHRPTSMQRLTRGSVICFGSAIGSDFCADTVLVIASAQPWTAADETIGRRLGQAFRACTAGAIASGDGSWARVGFTLFRGATFADPVEGMYSFVPAMPVRGDYPRFARPPIRLPGLINPASRQAAKGSHRPRPAPVVRDAWEAIRHQILTAGLVLAVQIATPHRRGGVADIPADAGTRC